MRRILGGIAVFLGVLGLVLGLMAGSLYDRLAKVPLDQDITAVSEGTGVSVLHIHNDGKGLAFDPLTDQTVRNTRVVKGVPGKVAEDERDTDAFWQLGLKTDIVGVGPLTMSIDGVSIDRHTAMATNSSGDFVSAGTFEEPGATKPIEHEGLFFKFPMGSEKKTYPFWDAQIVGTADAVFARTEKTQGLDTYVYEQKIPTTTMPGTRQVPRSMFGSSATGNVAATEEYTNTRTMWVEPTTGIIIRAQEDIERRLVSDAGTATIIKGVIGYTEDTQKALGDKYGSQASQLGFVRDTLRPLGLALGTLLTLLGLWLLFGGHRSRTAEPVVATEPTVRRGATRR